MPIVRLTGRESRWPGVPSPNLSDPTGTLDRMGTTGLLLLVAGVIVGFCAAVLLGRGRLAALTAERDAAAAQVSGLTGERDAAAARAGAAEVEVVRLSTTLEHERQAADLRLADLQQAQEELSQRFKVLTQEALDRTTERLTALTEE